MFLQCNIGTFSVQNKTAVLGARIRIKVSLVQHKRSL